MDHVVTSPILKFFPQGFIRSFLQSQQILGLLLHRPDPTLECLCWPQVWPKLTAGHHHHTGDQLQQCRDLGPSTNGSIQWPLQEIEVVLWFNSHHAYQHETILTQQITGPQHAQSRQKLRWEAIVLKIGKPFLIWCDWSLLVQIFCN